MKDLRPPEHPRRRFNDRRGDPEVEIVAVDRREDGERRSSGGRSRDGDRRGDPVEDGERRGGGRGEERRSVGVDARDRRAGGRSPRQPR